ncbi:TPA: hypothetical protein ACHWJ6_000999 [Streptococcus suis]
MNQLEKQIKAVSTFARKYKTQIKHRPALNQIKVIDGKGYFTNGNVAFYFNDAFPESVPLNDFTNEQIGDFYPDMNRLIDINGYPQANENNLAEMIDILKAGKDQGLWKDTTKNIKLYHIEEGKPVLGENVNYHNIDPRMLYHTLNCLKRLGEKTVEIALNPEKIVRPIRIKGKETGIEVLFCPIRIS